MGGVIVGLVVQELICTAAGGLSKILYILSTHLRPAHFRATAASWFAWGIVSVTCLQTACRKADSV